MNRTMKINKQHKKGTYEIIYTLGNKSLCMLSTIWFKKCTLYFAQRNTYVIITSKRCFDVIIMFSLRSVFAGIVFHKRSYVCPGSSEAKRKGMDKVNHRNQSNVNDENTNNTKDNKTMYIFHGTYCVQMNNISVERLEVAHLPWQYNSEPRLKRRHNICFPSTDELQNQLTQIMSVLCFMLCFSLSKYFYNFSSVENSIIFSSCW